MGIEGDEVAGDWTRNGAESPGDSVPKDYPREASATHTTRMAAGARSAGVGKWIVDVKGGCTCGPPKGPKLRKELRHERKALAGRYYQLLSGHAVIDGYLRNKIHKVAVRQVLVAARTRSGPVTTCS